MLGDLAAAVVDSGGGSIGSEGIGDGPLMAGDVVGESDGLVRCLGGGEALIHEFEGEEEAIESLGVAGLHG